MAAGDPFEERIIAQFTKLTDRQDDDHDLLTGHAKDITQNAKDIERLYETRIKRDAVEAMIAAATSSRLGRTECEQIFAALIERWERAYEERLTQRRQKRAEADAPVKAAEVSGKWSYKIAIIGFLGVLIGGIVGGLVQLLVKALGG